MKKYIIMLAAAFMLGSCADKLDVTPPNNITDEQIQQLLASGNEESIRLVMGSMANNMPLMFNYAGSNGVGNADMYYSNQGMDMMRSLQGNDMVLGDVSGLSALVGAPEYGFDNFISANSNKNVVYWNYGWTCINQANKMLNFLPDATVGTNKFLMDYKARGLIVRAYGYSYLMENYQNAYLQGGNGKLGVMLYDMFSPTQTSKPRSTAAETYAFIKADLTNAIRLFTEAGIGYTADLTDIDLAVANFLLARVSAWTGDWSTALAACNSILDKYPTLMSEAQYGGKNTGTETNPIYLPETNGFLNNAANPEVILGFPVGISKTYFNAYTNPFGEGNGGVLRNYKRIDNRLYEKIAANDYRKSGFMEKDFGDYTYPRNSTKAFIPAYTNTKFAATHGLGSTNKVEVGTVTCYYMRTSEVLLMKAEAQAQLNNAEDAKATLNKLLAARTKTGATALTCDTYPAMAGLSALQMVYLQTRIELWGEGGREFYNNKRWNIPVDRASSTNHIAKLSYPVANMTLQIPEDELLYNSLVVQN
ncbi:MAG TPA: RagB/SusD family nutrient uptake outer membrane protein [Dyadobacter sp.]|jgi:tetratricopeptide (TPR) repeat protein|nr:RagB/SusD family nutrient uptake outer membrane protein [Dyadobacter sp.]